MWRVVPGWGIGGHPNQFLKETNLFIKVRIDPSIQGGVNSVGHKEFLKSK
jgi:hypothetical protein